MKVLLLVLWWDIVIEFDGLKPEVEVDTTREMVGIGAGLDWS